MQNRISPNPREVTGLRAVVRARLFTSLHHLVFDVFGNGQGGAVTEDALRDLVLGSARFPPAPIFALHAAFLKAALAGEISEGPKLIEMLRNAVERTQVPSGIFTVTPLAKPALQYEEVLLLKRAFADDVGLTTTLEVPLDHDVARARDLLGAAMALLERAAPDWHAEVLLLGNQVYLATAPGAERQKFAGAAVFDAFGAVLINPKVLTSPSAALMTLVHETSHQQMFLYHLDDPIVLNADDATFSSPLRVQPRPMEGVFHAMWVSARMVVAAQAVLSAAGLPDWTDDLRHHQSDARRAFLDGADTVRQHAQLSERGTALFRDACEAVHAV